MGMKCDETISSPPFRFFLAGIVNREGFWKQEKVFEVFPVSPLRFFCAFTRFFQKRWVEYIQSIPICNVTHIYKSEKAFKKKTR